MIGSRGFEGCAAHVYRCDGPRPCSKVQISRYDTRFNPHDSSLSYGMGRTILVLSLWPSGWFSLEVVSWEALVWGLMPIRTTVMRYDHSCKFAKGHRSNGQLRSEERGSIGNYTCISRHFTAGMNFPRILRRLISAIICMVEYRL